MTGGKFGKILLYLMIAGIVIGIAIGGFLPETGKKMAFIGDFFIGYLKMLVIPLVITSMIAGVTGLGDVREIGWNRKKNYSLLYGNNRYLGPDRDYFSGYNWTGESGH